MRQHVIFLLLFSTFSLGLNAQLNDYKYIIVPKKFDAFNNENEHQTSTLIKYLFTQKGFNAVYEGDYPNDLKNDLCLGLKVDLNDKSSLFKTKTSLVLKDCEFKEVFRTHEGTSKLKDFKETYNEAIREAFTSFDIINYVYKEKPMEKKEGPITVSFKNDVKKLEEDKVKSVTEEKATLKKDVSIESMDSDIQQKSPVGDTEVPSDLLYALRTSTGYNLVDSNAQIKYKLLDTSVDNIFLLNQEGANGVVFFKDGKWYLELSSEGKKEPEELNIKF